MRKSSLGRRNSNRASTLGQLLGDASHRRSGIPVPTSSRSHSAERIPQRANSTVASSSSSAWDLMTPMTNRTLTARTPGTDRLSGRPSSMGGMQRKDNRLIFDKDWQTIAIDSIENVLVQLPGGSEVVGNGLKDLTQTKFIAACNLLLKVLGNSIEITKPNYLKEIPYLLLQKFGYRGKIEKSWMVAVSIPSSIPYALGVLQFLAAKVNALTSTNFNELLFPDRFDAAESDFKVLIPYFLKSRKLAATAPLDYEARQTLLDKEVKRELRDGFEDVAEKMDEIKAERAQLHKFQDKLDHEIQATARNERELKRKCESVENEIDQMNASHSEVANLEKSIAEKKAAYISLKERRDSLKRKIAEVFPNRKNLKELEEKNDSMHLKLTSGLEYIKAFQDMVYKSDIQIVQMKTQMEQHSREFNLKLMNYAVKDKRLEIFNLKSKFNSNDREVEKKEIFESMMSEFKAMIDKLETDIEAGKSKESKLKEMLEEQLETVSSSKKQLLKQYKDAKLNFDLPDQNKDLPTLEQEMQILRHLCSEFHITDIAEKRGEKKKLVAVKERQLEIAERVMEAQLEQIAQEYEQFVREQYKLQEEAGIPVPRLDDLAVPLKISSRLI